MVRLARDLAASVVLALVLFVGIDSITARSYVEGPSMEPTLHRGQVFLISRIGISGFTQQAFASTHHDQAGDGEGWVPPRGAIITFYHPHDPKTLLVKRVIGLPGEEISIQSGVVSIDGRSLEEPYVVYHDARSLTALRVPADSIFVMGDNRPESGDSRSFGPVPRSNLLGVIVLRYWPLGNFRLMVDDR